MLAASNTGFSSITWPTLRLQAVVLSLLAALCLSTPLHAQRTRNVAFERFSTEQGLSNYGITSILQDQNGFLWFGTQAGLNRYDGYTFTKYTAENSDLSDDFINTLYKDHLGIIWIGTQKAGVYAFDPRTEHFTGYAHDPEDSVSLSHNDVQAIYEDQNRTVWIGTRGGGLNRFDRDTERFTRYRAGPGNAHSLASDSVWAIHEAPSEPGVVWIGTEGGLNRLELRTQPTSTLSDLGDEKSLIHDVVRSIYADASGALWVGTQNSGLYALHPGTGSFRRYVHDPENPNSLASNYVNTIHEDQSGTLWIGTYDGGLNRLDRSTGRFARYENIASDPGSLPHNQVNTILMDRAGVLWVGTWGGLGKHIALRESVTHYTHLQEDPNSLSHPRVSSIYEDRSSVLWIGTLGGGLNRLDRRTNRVTRFPLPFEDVIAICEDRSGSLWLGTRDNNLYRFDRKTAKVTAYPLDAPGGAHGDDIVVTIYEAPLQPGVLWIGTKLNGLYTFDVQTREVTRHYLNDPAAASSLSYNYAWPVYEDRSGVLWVGTWGGGLNRFNRETESFTRYLHDDANPYSISGDRVVSIHEDREGRLWVGTFGRGLNRFNPSTEHFTHYTEQDGLPSNEITGILSDDEGYLWLSTNNGLSRFDPRTEGFVNYGVADGLQSSIFIIGAAHKNKRGELFFGGENGFNVIHPDRFTENLNESPVVLTDFHLFGEPARLDSSISALREITLDHDDNYVAFEFAVLDFTDPSKNQYAYMLEGVDNDWVDAGTQRYARYPKLAPDTYTFRVKGANSKNVWNEQGASVRLIIRPPWWQTPWAYAFYVVAVVSILFGGYKWRVRRLKKHARDLEQMVEERTEDLRAEKQKTEEQAAKLLELEQVKDRFFANISHEFRTPLTLILGPIEDALDGAYGSVPSRLRAQLDVMQRSGERLHRLINQLLDLSKLEVGRLHLHARKHDLISFVKGIVLSFASLAERRHVTLHCHAGADHLPLYVDADKLEKVITNLLSNALKFTPEQGKVWVSIHEVADEAGASSSPGGAWAEIRVKDTGRGIPADELPHIFDRFHQVDTSLTREHEGTGIGLALTKELVALHGGTIRAESEEGFGTTFFVRLPQGTDHLGPDDVVDDEAPAETPPLVEHAAHTAFEVADLASVPIEPDPADEVGPPEAAAPTILIVEDNADVRAYLKSHLASLYHIVEAVDGAEGLASARAVDPDLVISDVMMPKMDGIALCRALKQDEHLNHIPVILLTAKATDDSKIQGLTTGADDYIYKPFNAEVLLARVENLIEVRRILRQRFSGEVRVGPSEITVPSAEAAFLEQVREVVEAHLADSNFTVDWFAEEVGMSRRHLQRKLRESANLSPGGYIRMMRLERAAQLLEQRAGSVSEIAYRVGFKNADHFSRLFHRVFDVPPSKYPAE